jgi:large subunit ribosomal protein L25
MAVNAVLSAQSRAGAGKGHNRKLRASGRVPAVVYGHGEDTRSVSVDAHELERLFARIHIESTLIDLRIEGDRAPVKTLVREVQRNAVRDDVLHVDFYVIHAGELVTVEIPVRISGSAPGVKIGGLLQQTLDVLEVRCLPDRIPENFEVDISVLGIGDSVHVRDLAVPEGVEVLVDGDRTVCSVIPPTVTAEDVEAAAAQAATTEPEVIGRGKEEDEE